MSKQRVKVFHLEMDGQHYYFGSPKAMFDIMGEEKMGMRYASFHSNISLKIGDVYKNRRHGYIIRLGLLGQAQTNRGNRLEERINKEVASALAAHGIVSAELPVEEATAEEKPVEAPIMEEPIVEAPAVEAPAEEKPIEASVIEAPIEEKPVETPAPKKGRKKKNADIPEQLTLF